MDAMPNAPCNTIVVEATTPKLLHLKKQQKIKKTRLKKPRRIMVALRALGRAS
jgi:hypothetical protein